MREVIKKKESSNLFSLLKSSFVDMWRFPVSFVPVIYSFAAFIVLGVLSFLSFKFLFGLSIDISSKVIIPIGIFVLVVGIIFFFISIHISSIGVFVYSLVYNNTDIKKISFKKIFVGANGLYWKVFRLFFVRLLFFLPFLFLIGLIFFIASLVGQSWFHFFSTIIFLVLILLYLSCIIFTSPMIGSFFDSTFLAVKTGFSLVKIKMGVVFKTLGFVLLLYLAFQAIIIVLSLLFGIDNEQNAFFVIIQVILSSILSVWSALFIYNVYFSFLFKDLKRVVKKK